MHVHIHLNIDCQFGIWIVTSTLILILDSQLNFDVDNHINIHCHVGTQKKFFQLLSCYLFYMCVDIYALVIMHVGRYA